MNFRNRNIKNINIFSKICTEVGPNLFLTIIKIFLAAQMQWNVKNTEWTCIFWDTASFYPKAFVNGTFLKEIELLLKNSLRLKKSKGLSCIVTE